MPRLFAALVTLVLALPLAGAPVPKHLMPKEEPFAFPTRVGTTWVYEGDYGKKTIVISAVTEEKDGSKLVTTEWVEDGQRSPHMVTRVSTAGIFLVAEQGTKYDAPWCLFKLPHREGQTWETKVSGRGSTGTGTITAGPVEKIKVPAGEFSAARVYWEHTYNGGGEIKATYWYAHGIGLVRMDEDMKLKSFTPGKD